MENINVMCKFPEIKESKQSSAHHRSEALAGHCVHNGNIRSAPLYRDQRKLETIEDEDKIMDRAEELTASEAEGSGQDDVATKVDIEHSNPCEGDGYEHSLWKWPSGRSKLTKVFRVFT